VAFPVRDAREPGFVSKALPVIERITLQTLVAVQLTPISTEAGFDLAYATWLPQPTR
jgi:hypothetical protein